MRVLQGDVQTADPRRFQALLEPVRTRVMVLVAAACTAAALVAQLYPGPLAALCCLLLAAGCTVPLRASKRVGLLAGLGTAAAALVGAGLALLSPDPRWAGLDAVTPPSVAAAGSLLCGSLVAGCSLLSLWTSRAISRPPLAWGGGLTRTHKTLLSAPTVQRREAALERLDWELARAGEYRRPLTLCLLGLDPVAGDEDASRLAGAMGRVDQLLLQELSRFELASEHGPAERLLVLPELWADGFAEDAARLCALASGRVRKTARAALVTFPFDGTRPETLLADLESALARCRAGDALLAIGTVGREPVAVTTDFAS